MVLDIRPLFRMGRFPPLIKCDFPMYMVANMNHPGTQIALYPSWQFCVFQLTVCTLADEFVALFHRAQLLGR